jgi:rSAM-associated Gly-rich repeat protein
MSGDIPMNINKALMAAAVLLFAVPAAPALAHDDDVDHADHWRLHRDLGDAHRRAHEEGFYSRAEHNAYHRALRDLHRDFHEDHPGNWHDHDQWRGYRGGWRYGGWQSGGWPNGGGWRYGGS